MNSTAQQAPALPPPPPPSFHEEALRLFNVLNPPLSGSEGVLVQFIGSRRDEGTSTIARAFARICALHSDKRVLLLDLDWARQTHYDHFLNEENPTETLRPGPAMELGVDPSEAIRVPGMERAPFVTFHSAGDTNLILSRVDTERVPKGQLPRLVYQPHFWRSLKENVAMVVVDSPPADASLEGITVSGLMDAVVLVIEANVTRLPVIEDLRNKLLANDAPLVGTVFNKRRFYIPKAVYRWL